ncbi:hypothetical protein MBLNU457_5827t1 [Dothideomycetes sp. NU457]
MARTRTGQHSGARQVSTITGAEAGADSNKLPVRMTRSQSREPVQSNPIRSQQRAAHGQNTASPNTHGVEIGHLNDIDEDAYEDESVINARQQSVLSGGLSARTTFSQDDVAEVRELDPEMVIDSFPDLLPRANEVLNLVFKELDNDLSFIETADSRKHKFLTKRVHDYNSQKDSFSSQIYIRPDIVSRALLKLRSNQQIAPDPWRPDEIIFKANLAGLFGHFSQCGNTTKQVEVLQALDSEFPRRFMLSLEAPQAASGHVGESVLAEETCLLALDLRTQLAVKFIAFNALNLEPDAPQAVLAQVFLDGDYANADTLPDELDPAMLRSFDLISDSAHPAFREHVIHRVKDLEAAFDEYENIDQAIHRLEEKYSWSDFRLRLVQWVKLRSEELSASIIKRGGGSNIDDSADKIIARLARKMAKIDPSIARILGDRITRTPRASGTSAAPLSSNPASPHRNQASASGKSNAIANTAGVANKTNYMQPFSHEEEDDDEDAFEGPAIPPPPRGPTRPSRPAAATSREASVPIENVNEAVAIGTGGDSFLVKPSASGKSTSLPTEKSYMDRQRDAQKVHFSQASPQRTRPPGQRKESPSPPPTSSVTGKRTRQDPVILIDDEGQGSQEEPSQDRGFQGNTRSNGVVRRAASIPNSSRTLPSTLEEPAAAPSPPKRVRQNPGQSIDRPPPDSTVEDAENKTWGQKAAAINLINRSRARILHGQPQSRTPWGDAEVTWLIELIEKFGTSWKILKDEDEKSLKMFAIRDQVGLRDKARNLRVDFEIAQARDGTPMPANFHLVALGIKEYEKLEKAGVYLERERVRSKKARKPEDSD